MSSKSSNDLIRLGMWIFQYIATLTLFAMGFYAPGVPKRRYGLMIVSKTVFCNNSE